MGEDHLSTVKKHRWLKGRRFRPCGKQGKKNGEISLTETRSIFQLTWRDTDRKQDEGGTARKKTIALGNEKN